MDFMSGGFGFFGAPGHPGVPPPPRRYGDEPRDTREGGPGCNWLLGWHRDDGSMCVHGVLAEQAAPGTPVPEDGYTCRDGRPWVRELAAPAVVPAVEYEVVTAAPPPRWRAALARFLLARTALVLAVATGVIVILAVGWLAGTHLPLPWAVACLAAGLALMTAGRTRRRR